MSKEIMINQFFAGKYLDEGENIGHEVINLFKDDEGNHNLFITPSGRVSGHELEYIIFVRHVYKRKTAEIIGLAKKLRTVTKEEIENAKYGGVTLEQIFSNNKYHGDNDNFSDHITFRAEEFLLPAYRIFITLDNYEEPGECTIKLNSEKQAITPQGMRGYYSDEKDCDAYRQLLGIIKKSKNWNSHITIPKLYSDGIARNYDPAFLEIIRKENDENIFSNLFAYYFEYSHVAFKRFASDILEIPEMSVSFHVFRETKHRVDLWIESDTDIIVIENKIKSGINGVTKDDYSQLNEYYKKAKQEAEGYGKNTHFYIFAPDYAKFEISRFGTEIEKGYKLIRYSVIYKFFVKETETYIADRTFPDFIRSLKRHTLSFSELQFDIMRSRLLRRISVLQ